jgi:hypothetical protein
MNTSNQFINPDSNSKENIGDGQTASSFQRSWDQRAQRHAERLARLESRWQRHGGRVFGWFVGASLILIGIIYLLQDLGITYPTNWWALFILIPALWAFFMAWESFQENQRITWRTIRSFTLGILAAILTIAYLMNLDVVIYWPLLLILAGLFFLGIALIPRSS